MEAIRKSDDGKYRITPKAEDLAHFRKAVEFSEGEKLHAIKLFGGWLKFEKEDDKQVFEALETPRSEDALILSGKEDQRGQLAESLSDVQGILQSIWNSRELAGGYKASIEKWKAERSHFNARFSEVLHQLERSPDAKKRELVTEYGLAQLSSSEGEEWVDRILGQAQIPTKERRQLKNLHRSIEEKRNSILQRAKSSLPTMSLIIPINLGISPELGKMLAQG